MSPTFTIKVSGKNVDPLLVIVCVLAKIENNNREKSNKNRFISMSLALFVLKYKINPIQNNQGNT